MRRSAHVRSTVKGRSEKPAFRTLFSSASAHSVIVWLRVICAARYRSMKSAEYGGPLRSSDGAGGGSLAAGSLSSAAEPSIHLGRASGRPGGGGPAPRTP